MLQQESDLEMAVRICGPKTRIFSGGEIQLFATSAQFEEFVRQLVAKHVGRSAITGGPDHVDPTDTEAAALEWITSTIKLGESKGEHGYVENEVVAEFNTYRKNHPQGSPLDQAKSAMHACAHQ